jgi:hypothetical protein
MDPRNGQYIVHDDKQVFSVVAASAARDGGIFKPGKGYRLNCAKVDGGKALWSVQVPVRIMSIVNTPTKLYAAGTPDIVDPDDPWAALAGRKGGRLLIIAKKDGSTVKAEPLAAAPVLDGLAVAHGRLFIVLKNGQLICRGSSAVRN